MDKTSFSETYESQMSSSVVSRLTDTRLENMRSTSIGGASLSAALVFLLLQTKLDEFTLKLSLVCVPR
jgi:hypothetical protein